MKNSKYVKFYLCNKKQSCNMSPLCGRTCNHTRDEHYRLESSSKVWDFSMVEGEIRMIERLSK